MCSDDAVGSPPLYRAVTPYDVVVANRAPSAGFVPRVDLSGARGLCGLDGRTMDDEVVDFHGLGRFARLKGKG